MYCVHHTTQPPLTHNYLKIFADTEETFTSRKNARVHKESQRRILFDLYILHTNICRIQTLNIVTHWCTWWFVLYTHKLYSYCICCVDVLVYVLYILVCVLHVNERPSMPADCTLKPNYRRSCERYTPETHTHPHTHTFIMEQSGKYGVCIGVYMFAVISIRICVHDAYACI